MTYRYVAPAFVILALSFLNFSHASIEDSGCAQSIAEHKAHIKKVRTAIKKGTEDNIEWAAIPILEDAYYNDVLVCVRSSVPVSSEDRALAAAYFKRTCAEDIAKLTEEVSDLKELGSKYVDDAVHDQNNRKSSCASIMKDLSSS